MISRTLSFILLGLPYVCMGAEQDLLSLRPKTADQVIVLPEAAPNPFVLSPQSNPVPTKPAIVHNNAGEAPTQEIASWAREAIKAWNTQGEIMVFFEDDVIAIGEKIDTESLAVAPDVTVTEVIFQGVTSTHAIYRISGFRRVEITAEDPAASTVENRNFNETVQVLHPEFLAP